MIIFYSGGSHTATPEQENLSVMLTFFQIKFPGAVKKHRSDTTRRWLRLKKARSR